MSVESAYEELPASKRRQLIIRAGLRALATAVVLVALFYVLPLDRTTSLAVAIDLVVGLTALVVIVAWQVRGIMGARYPRAKMIEAVFVAAPLYLVLFASAYFLMASASSGSFGQPLTRTDALYFGTTVFTTVGFGDISAKSQVARVVVTIQMVVDLVFLGVGLKLLVGAAQQSVRRRTTAVTGAPETSGVGRADPPTVDPSAPDTQRFE